MQPPLPQQSFIFAPLYIDILPIPGPQYLRFNGSASSGYCKAVKYRLVAVCLVIRTLSSFWFAHDVRALHILFQSPRSHPFFPFQLRWNPVLIWRVIPFFKSQCIQPSLQILVILVIIVIVVIVVIQTWFAGTCSIQVWSRVVRNGITCGGFFVISCISSTFWRPSVRHGQCAGSSLFTASGGRPSILGFFCSFNTRSIYYLLTRLHSAQQELSIAHFFIFLLIFFGWWPNFWGH